LLPFFVSDIASVIDALMAEDPDRLIHVIPHHRCELKRRKMNMSGIGKPRIMLDFKACTMTCIDEVIQLSKNS